MVSQTTCNWILLSVRKEGSDLKSIMWSADGINKAIPNLEELNDSLGWLKAAGLIELKEAVYKRTNKANIIIAECEGKTKNIFDLWDDLAESFNKILVTEYKPEQITQEKFEFFGSNFK